MNCPHCQAPNVDDARFCGSCGRATLATEPAPSPNLAEAPVLVGREIAGRYRIQAKLGEGGMGAVFKAEQISLKRTVAVKLLRPEMASSPLLLRRFNAEAEAVAKLSHPNTVNIYDFGQDSDGTLFIAMEYIEGDSLRHVIHREAPFGLRRALSIGLQVASSLTDAHSRSIIHRDLKPDNVMLQQRGREKDIVRVLDFGIAKLRDENRQSQMAMTQAGDMLGTPQYMAPEQIRAETIDGRTDVYALGCLLYEMITARLPFEAPTIMSLLSKHLLETTVPPSQRRPDLGLPPAIDHLVLSAMAKDPKVRPPTMEAFADQMAALMATLPVDTMQNTAQRLVPATPAQAIATPAAYSAIAPSSTNPTPTYATHGPQMPPPAVAAPTGPAPASGGYVPPPAGAPPYNPHAAPPQSPLATEQPRGGGSNKALWIVLGVLVLAGVGVGIYMAKHKTESKPDPWADRGSGSGSQVMTAGSAEVAGSPAVADSPAKGSAVDVWADRGSAAPAAPLAPPDDDDPVEPPDPVVDDSKFTPLMQGVKIQLPYGFAIRKSSADGFLATDSRGMMIIAFPITGPEKDFTAMARAYAKDAKLVLAIAQPNAFGDRGFAVLKGKYGGVTAIHMGTAVIGPGYSVALIVHMPEDLTEHDMTAAQLPMQLFMSGISVPATVSP